MKPLDPGCIDFELATCYSTGASNCLLEGFTTVERAEIQVLAEEIMTICICTYGSIYAKLGKHSIHAQSEWQNANSNSN